MQIKTNKVKYHIDCAGLDSQFDFFKVSTSDDYFKNGAHALDAPALDNNVQAVLFERGKSFYVMMLSDAQNKQRLKEVLLKSEEGKTISLEKVSSCHIVDSVLLQLLINGLGSSQSSILRFNNLTGHLYCFHPKWLVYGKKTGADVIWKIPCLEIKITKDCKLQLTVHTFTSELLKKKITFTKKKFDDYPKYVFSNKNTLRRKLADDTETCYVMRQTDNAKTEIPFLNISDLDKFNESKMGILYEVISSFNQKYSGICSIEWEAIPVSECLCHKRKQDKILDLRVKERLSVQGIHIVDLIGNNYSAIFCIELSELIRSQYGITATIGKRLKKETLNLELIHNAVYYIDMEDPHQKNNDGYVVQHITFEDYNCDSAFALKTVMHELIIKEDLQKGSISLFDWKSFGLGAISFGLKSTIEDIDRYFFMDISEDGSFTISEQKLDLFSENEYYKLLRIFEDANTVGENIVGLIKNAHGDINVIKDTDWFGIPEINEIYNHLKSGDNKLRGEEKRKSLLSSSLDIQTLSIPDENGLYYFVGDIGEGMRPVVQHAANIRKIESVAGAPILFEDLLPLMDVTFVRNGQLTVVPFPFKYLREYLNQFLFNQSET